MTDNFNKKKGKKKTKNVRREKTQVNTYAKKEKRKQTK